jgi:hypothetical protein
VLAALAKVTSFNAGGLLGTTNIAEQVPNGCFVMMKVSGDKFVRAEPTAAGQLNCGSGNLTARLGP